MHHHGFLNFGEHHLENKCSVAQGSSSVADTSPQTSDKAAAAPEMENHRDHNEISDRAADSLPAPSAAAATVGNTADSAAHNSGEDDMQFALQGSDSPQSEETQEVSDKLHLAAAPPEGSKENSKCFTEQRRAGGCR